MISVKQYCIGIYVPTLAHAILTATDNGNYTGAPLVGIAVGNGCTGTQVGICASYFNRLCDGLYYQVQYIMGLAFTDIELKKAIDIECDWEKCLQPGAKDSVLSKNCSTLIDLASYMMGDINIYNVYGRCVFNACDDPKYHISRVGSTQGNSRFVKGGLYGQNAGSGNHLTPIQESNYDHIYAQVYGENYISYAKRQKKLNEKPDSDKMKSSGYVDATDDNMDPFQFNYDFGPAGCIDSYAATTYLMNPDVQKAIHVKPINYCWASCNSIREFKYHQNQPNLPRDMYPYIISKIRVLIYNGDWDACVPYTDNQVSCS